MLTRQSDPLGVLGCSAGETSRPFGDTGRGIGSAYLSCIGAALLMHDMGYLSQFGDAKDVRDNDGVVLPKFQSYGQTIRTPALKGLRFNCLAADSHPSHRQD